MSLGKIDMFEHHKTMLEAEIDKNHTSDKVVR